jgi:hypothetical protein
MIADHTGVAVEDIVNGLGAAGCRCATPLPGPWRNEYDHVDVAASDGESSSIAGAEDRCFVSQHLRLLSMAEREVLALSFFADLTQSEIAVRLGVSQATVSRVYRQALHRLRVLVVRPRLQHDVYAGAVTALGRPRALTAIELLSRRLFSVAAAGRQDYGFHRCPAHAPTVSIGVNDRGRNPRRRAVCKETRRATQARRKGVPHHRH